MKHLSMICALPLLVASFLGLNARPAAAVFFYPIEAITSDDVAVDINQVSPQTFALVADDIVAAWSVLLQQPTAHPEIAGRWFKAGSWEAESRLLTGDDAQYSSEAAVAAEGGRAAMAWIDYRTGGLAVWAAELNRVTGELEDPQQVSPSGELVLDPAIAIGADGELHVAWTRLSNFRAEVGWSQRLPDGTWSQAGIISPNDGIESAAVDLAVAADGIVYAVWSDRQFGRSSIFHRSFRDGAWLETRDLDANAEEAQSTQPTIDIDAAGRLHVAWQRKIGLQTFVLYDHFEPGGLPEAPIRIGGSSNLARAPSLAVEPGGVAHIAFEDGVGESLAARTSLMVSYARVEDRKVTEARAVSEVDPGPYLAPTVRVDARGGLHFIWRVNTDERDQLLYRRGGLTFQPATPGR